MKYLLDTNICIAHLKGEPAIRQKLAALGSDQVFLCSVVKAELLYGARNSGAVEKNLRVLATFFRGLASVAFDDAAAEVFGAHQSYLKRSGQSIGMADVLIASIAQAQGLTVVTRNGDHFARIPGLRIEAW
ncbi:MAG: type II toxin-antitoxin system VapC family toxin [Bdellovibrionota bacterium]